MGRRGPWFAAIWLFFLLDPLLVGWHHRDTAAGVAGMVLTIAFGATYMGIWLRLRADRAKLQDEPPAAMAALWLARPRRARPAGDRDARSGRDGDRRLRAPSPR